MACTLRWLGHNCWSLDVDGHHVLLDPFLTESPTAPIAAEEVKADTILISHGHFDHVADAVEIARRTAARCVATFEIHTWLNSQGIDNTEPMNNGGSIDLPFGRVTLTTAVHSSSLPDGTYAGEAGGFVLAAADVKIYFACDTALFGDMQLIGAGGIDLAVLPIGDRFTMGIGDSIKAIELLQPKRVTPCHYNTWPPIEQDAQAWADAVKAHTSAEPIVLEPGGTISL